MARQTRPMKTKQRTGLKTWHWVLGLVVIFLLLLSLMALGIFKPLAILSEIFGFNVTWPILGGTLLGLVVGIKLIIYFFVKLKELLLDDSEEELTRTIEEGPRRRTQEDSSKVLSFQPEQQDLFKMKQEPTHDIPVRKAPRPNVYEEEEFASFQGGLKKENSFKNILNFGKNDPYKDEAVRAPIENDPINVPSWVEPEGQAYVPSYTDPKTYVPIKDEPRVYMQSKVDYHMTIRGVQAEEGSCYTVKLDPPLKEEVISQPPTQASMEEIASEKEVTAAVPEKATEASVEEKPRPEPIIINDVNNISPATVPNAAAKVAEEESDRFVNKYKFPPVELLNPPIRRDPATYQSDIMDQCSVLEQTLADFKVRARVVAVTRGPSVTRFELEPAPGVKVSSVVNLADDIALRLAAPGVRIEAPIPGKSAIGIEAPNTKTDAVCFREIIESQQVREGSDKLNIGLGMDISGNIITCNLAKMPHLLVAGSTGSGKSVCINTIIAGLLYKASPEDCKLILVDPKVVELSNYNGIPHLLTPVVTDAKKAASALHWAVAEMERRYQLFADNHVREINSYNVLAKEMHYDHLPFIVIIIDELSDLMMVAKVDVEEAILRLAQKARACGIHLVIATQRPSVDVITGIVKANIPSRIAFAVSSLIDSRTILDMGGAEKLLGKGDMLFSPIGQNKPVRVQGAFVSDNELNKIVDFIIKQSLPCEYTKEVTEQALSSDPKPEDRNEAGDVAPTEDDPLFKEALELVLDLGQASASMFQRRYRIGYNRAARLVDTMEELGIVGQAVGSKPREVIISREEAEAKFL